MPEVEANRKTKYEVSPLFVNRWSSRAFSEKEVTKEVLYAIIEAASWAPSASNEQPWRFVIAETKEKKDLFHSFINPRNQLWTEKAPVLLLLASKKQRSNGNPNGTHSFDTGAFWGYFALQASILGLSTRAVGGFDKESARKTLQIPEDLDLHAVIALGYRGQRETLHEDFQEVEKPNTRRPFLDNSLPF